MPRFLLDSSVWLAAHDSADAEHDACRRIVLAPDCDRAALDLTLYEVANIATVKWGDAALARRLVEVVTTATAGHVIFVDIDQVTAAIDFAETHKLTVYDAAYPAAARGTEDEVMKVVSIDSDLTVPGLAIHPRDLP